MCFLAFSHQYLHNFSFQSHWLLFSHASAEVRGENMPERKFTSTEDRTQNHKVMSPTSSPLSNPGGAAFHLGTSEWIGREMNSPFPKQALVFTCLRFKSFENTVGKGESAHNEQFLLFPQCFPPVWRSFCHFRQIWNCCLQTLSFWKS